jgi:hypothetical protein
MITFSFDIHGFSIHGFTIFEKHWSFVTFFNSILIISGFVKEGVSLSTM